MAVGDAFAFCTSRPNIIPVVCFTLGDNDRLLAETRGLRGPAFDSSTCIFGRGEAPNLLVKGRGYCTAVEFFGDTLGFTFAFVLDQLPRLVSSLDLTPEGLKVYFFFYSVCTGLFLSAVLTFLFGLILLAAFTLDKEIFFLDFSSSILSFGFKFLPVNGLQESSADGFERRRPLSGDLLF